MRFPALTLLLLFTPACIPYAVIVDGEQEPRLAKTRFDPEAEEVDESALDDAFARLRIRIVGNPDTGEEELKRIAAREAFARRAPRFVVRDRFPMIAAIEIDAIYRRHELILTDEELKARREASGE